MRTVASQTGMGSMALEWARHLAVVLLLGILPLVVSCGVEPKTVTLQPVEPGPIGQRAAVATGYLKVYTAVKSYPYDRQYYYAHTAYGIYDLDGHRVRSVDNEASFHTPVPEVVPLPAGRYNVVAWADGYELVKVPVMIELGRLTVVNLENHGRAGLPEDGHGDLVRTSDGRVVGWSATVPGP